MVFWSSRSVLTRLPAWAVPANGQSIQALVNAHNNPEPKYNQIKLSTYKLSILPITVLTLFQVRSCIFWDTARWRRQLCCWIGQDLGACCATAGPRSTTEGPYGSVGAGIHVFGVAERKLAASAQAVHDKIILRIEEQRECDLLCECVHP